MDDAGFEQYVIKRLTEYILATGLSSYKIADKTGLSPCTVYNFVHGKSKPSLFLVGILINFLKIDPAEFFSGYKAADNHDSVVNESSEDSMEMLKQIYTKVNKIEKIVSLQH